MAKTIENWDGWARVETSGSIKIGDIHSWLKKHDYRLADDYCLLNYDRKSGKAIWIINGKEKAMMFKLSMGGM